MCWLGKVRQSIGNHARIYAARTPVTGLKFKAKKWQRRSERPGGLESHLRMTN